MFDVGSYSVWEVMALSAIGSSLSFALTYATFGARAERFPVAAILAALLLHPWWAALTAGLVSHSICAVAARAIKRRPVGTKRKLAFGISMGAMIVAQQVALGMDNEAVVAAVRKGEAISWERIANSSQVGKFVAENYRPCVEARETFLQYMNRRFMMNERVNDPATCKAAAIANAKQKGDEFSGAVATEIDNLPSKLELSAEAAAEIDRVVHRWGI